MHWIDKFRPALESTAFDDRRNQLITFKFAEAAAQKIKEMPKNEPPDIAILDANLNGNDAGGFTVSRALQRKWPDLPIIYLSEHSGTAIEETAFESAATQDFIAKNQRNVEGVLCWRIKSILRQRNAKSSQNQLISGDLVIDLDTWEVFWCGKKLMNPANPKRALAPTPRKILRHLIDSSPRPLATLQMAEALDADLEKFSWANYRQHIKILRKSFDYAEGSTGSFTERCKQGQGIVAFGDEGAYCWKVPHV